ncbi:aminopeptidase N-like [Nylanderia fulva]|uniref:aminopeptidase N-like n=1 Tax=Nylanderia fulva TaxID=613905 RepID=UPI0010FB571C|nr:aminopeptidase N-like [Nylanderia fulva]
MNNPFLSTFWFNMGLTTFLAIDAVDWTYPELQIMNLCVVQNQHYSFSLDGDYHMWNSPMQNNSLLNIRQSIRASFLVRMLQHAFTKQLFWKSVRSYILDSESMVQFGAKLEAAVGKHITRQLMTGRYKKTHYCPIIKIIRNYGDTMNKVNVSIQYIDTLEIDCLPVTFTREACPHFKNFTHYMVCVGKDLKLSLTSNESGWMIFNIQQIGYYRVNYDKENWQRISNYLNSEYYTKIHVLNRAQIIDDAFHLMIAGQLDSYLFWDIIKYLHREEDYIAWYPMFKALEYMFGTFSALGEKFNNVKELTRHILGKVLREIKYEEIHEKDELRKCLRQEAARWDCFLGSTTCKKEANNKLKQHIKDFQTHR